MEAAPGWAAQHAVSRNGQEDNRHQHLGRVFQPFQNICHGEGQCPRF